MYRWAVFTMGLLLFMVLESCAPSDSSSKGGTAPRVVFDRAVHFSAPNGGEVLVEPGSYEIQAAAEAQLRLKARGKPSLLVRARRLEHDIPVDRPEPFLLPGGKEDVRHLALVLPGGRGWEAAGSTRRGASRAFEDRIRKPQLEIAASQVMLNRIGQLDQSILKGTEVPEEQQQFRGLVSVNSRDMGTGRRDCSGVLISNQWVLTAGHCILDHANAGLVTVNAQWPRPGKNQNLAYGDAIYEFSDGFDLRGPDLALIHLAEGIFSNTLFLNDLHRAPVVTGQKFIAYGAGFTRAFDPKTGVPAGGEYTWTRADLTVAGINTATIYENETFWYQPNALQQITMPGDSGGPDFILVDGVPVVAGIHAKAAAVCADRSSPQRCAETVLPPASATSVSVSTFRDWILAVIPPVVGNLWDARRPSYAAWVSHPEVIGTRQGFVDIDTTTWAQAARAASTMCFNRGFVTGHFDGRSAVQRGPGFFQGGYGLLCSGPGAVWRDAKLPEIAATGHGFDDVQAVPWAQANRAAAALCPVNQGFAGGRFNGHQLRDLRGLICYQTSVAQWFDATTGELAQTGFPVGDLNFTSWAQAARAATEFCRRKGPDIYKTFWGGFLNGHQLGDKRGVVCLRMRPA